MRKFFVYSLIFVPIICFAATPDSLFGTYEQIRRYDETSSFLVIDKKSVSIDECKKLPYKTIDSSDNHIVIDVVSSQTCTRKIIKIERKTVQYDVKTFTDFIVTIYKNYDDNLNNKPIETRRYSQADPSKAADQKDLFLNGKSNQQRRQALREMNLQGYKERNKYNEIGLRDHSPDVREIAASFLRGKPEHFIPMLINIIAHDPNAEVRASAGYSLDHFYTDNGSDGYLYIKPLEKNLDKLLMGLKNKETVRSVTNILGYRYTGDSFAPCYMSNKNREIILNALRNQLKTIKLIFAKEWRGDSIDDDRWNNEWNEANNEIPMAIKNISKCQPTK